MEKNIDVNWELLSQAREELRKVQSDYGPGGQALDKSNPEWTHFCGTISASAESASDAIFSVINYADAHGESEGARNALSSMAPGLAATTRQATSREQEQVSS